MDEVLTAFLNGRKKTVNNTRTDGKSIFLFDNEIIKKDENNDYWINDCGWATITTQERLNSFLHKVDIDAWVGRHHNRSYLIISRERDENGRSIGSKDYKQEITEKINITQLVREVKENSFEVVEN